MNCTEPHLPTGTKQHQNLAVALLAYASWQHTQAKYSTSVPSNIAMDSMRSLNTSLPTPYSSRAVPPEHLLQAFRSAALSVTNLYKSAVQDQNNNRTAGYQDALDDLLRFLDTENLGLQDGEGWRVRQWVTERYDGTANQPTSEGEDEKTEVENTRDNAAEQQQSERESSPPVQAEERPTLVQQNRAAFADNAVQEPPQAPDQAGFHFRYPSEASMRLQTERETLSAPPQSSPISDSDSTPTSNTRPIAAGRGLRGGQRVGTLRQNSNRFSTRTPGTGSGSKRKNPFPDINFFDIGFGPKDGTDPSSKRGRFA